VGSLRLLAFVDFEGAGLFQGDMIASLDRRYNDNYS